MRYPWEDRHSVIIMQVPGWATCRPSKARYNMPKNSPEVMVTGTRLSIMAQLFGNVRWPIQSPFGN